MTTYNGSCHCGAVRFKVDAQIDHARECDCSVCSKRGILTFRVGSGALQMLTPIDELATYRWGTKTATDYFCQRCGILPFRKPSLPTQDEQKRGVQPFEGWAINLRCIDGLDLTPLPRIKIRGSELNI